MSSIQSVIYQVDLTHVPRIYPTDNPEYYAQYCIDFQPETVPSVAAFKTEKQAHSFLIQQFGEEQYRAWFPELYTQEHNTCYGCYRYAPVSVLEPVGTIGNRMCDQCRARLVIPL